MNFEDINILSQYNNFKEIEESYFHFDELRIGHQEVIFHKEITFSNVKYTGFLDQEISDALSKLPKNGFEVVKQRLLEDMSLQEIGKHLNVTRERVRQIEDASLRKLQLLIPKSIFLQINDHFRKEVYFDLKKLPIQDTKLRDFIVSVISHPRFRNSLILDKTFNMFVRDKGFTYQNLKELLLEEVNKQEKLIWSERELVSLIKSNFPMVDYQLFLDALIKNEVQVIERGYFFNKSITTKRQQVEFIYLIHKDGFETHKQVKELRIQLNSFFPDTFLDMKDRAITGLTSYSDKILLWEWGKHIHHKHIEDILENYDFSDLLEYIDQELEGLTAVDLNAYYKANETSLKEFGIPSEHALHTMLKVKYPEDYFYQDSPRISSLGTARLDLNQVLLDAMNENRIYTLEELMDILKSPLHRVQQLIDRVNDVITVDTFQYIKKDFLNISDDLLEMIVSYLNEEVQKLHFLYVDLVVDKFRQELNVLSKYNSDVMLLDLLRKSNLKKNFQISNKRIVDKNYIVTRRSLNFHYLLDQFMDDRDEISKNELFRYFYIRGLSAKIIMHYYLYSGLKLLVRKDDETFVKLSSLSISEEEIVKINDFVETLTTSELSISDFLDEYIDVLPKVTRKWNRYILGDILDKSIFRLLPNSENPQYVRLK